MSDCISDLTNHPNLCPALRWKGQFVLSERDPSAQTGTDQQSRSRFRLPEQ